MINGTTSPESVLTLFRKSNATCCNDKSAVSSCGFDSRTYVLLSNATYTDKNRSLGVLMCEMKSEYLPVRGLVTWKYLSSGAEYVQSPPPNCSSRKRRDSVNSLFQTLSHIQSRYVFSNISGYLFLPAKSDDYRECHVLFHTRPVLQCQIYLKL